MKHAFVTVVIGFEDGRRGAVLRELAALHEPAPKGRTPYALRPSVREALDATRVIHFMSINVLPPSGEGEQARLLFELTVDGGPSHALTALCARLRGELAAVLGAAGIDAGEEPLARFLLRHHREVGQAWGKTPGLAFDGTPGMTVARIKDEARLVRRIERHLDALPLASSALEKLTKVREALWRDDAMVWAFEPVPIEARARRPALHALLPGLPAFTAELFWPFLIAPAGLCVLCGLAWSWIGGLAAGGALLAAEVALAYRALRRRERTDAPDDSPPDVELLDHIQQREDRCAQNHLFIRSRLKPGLLRDFTLRLALFAIRQTVTRAFPPGFLGDIGTIHFARWIVLPGTRDLVFFSNYAGSWESYLEDFIQRAHLGLTGIWSNTQGFPKARRLFLEGATDGARFKRWARRQQLPTAFWYSAYPELTNGRIRKNAAIRAGIAAAKTEHEAEAWLAHLGARAPGSLETEEIPTLVFGGLRRLSHATCLLLRLGDAVPEAKRWLAAVSALSTHGEARSATQAVVVGLSASGLLRLGLTRAQLATFPIAFQHGSVLRAHRLGDVGDDAPEQWTWGHDDTRVDAVLVLYASTQSDLAALCARVASASQPGIAIVREVPLEQRLDAQGRLREPFGFVDGISQPVIAGTRRALSNGHSDQRLQPGEMILGYPDGLGFLPHTPTVADADDPERLLAALPGGLRDLGRNGTFLIVRQIEQHVAAFEELVRDAAAAAVRAGAVPSSAPSAEEWVAAKLVGRWRDGSSLVRYPDAPASSGSAPDNDFRFGAEDPDGLRCPFGAHVRRANPRESAEPNSQGRVDITNRHRILRVGRSYRLSGTPPSEGLMFMCLNADIERQFEHVQQTWLRASSFHQLRDEVDPMLACANSAEATVLTVPTTDGPLRIRGPIRKLVTLRGSGYFFLPSRRALRFLSR